MPSPRVTGYAADLDVYLIFDFNGNGVPEESEVLEYQPVDSVKLQ